MENSEPHHGAKSQTMACLTEAYPDHVVNPHHHATRAPVLAMNGLVHQEKYVAPMPELMSIHGR